MFSQMHQMALQKEVSAPWGSFCIPLHNIDTWSSKMSIWITMFHFTSGGKAAVGLFGKALTGIASAAEQDKGERELMYRRSIFFSYQPICRATFFKIMLNTMVFICQLLPVGVRLHCPQAKSKAIFSFDLWGWIKMNPKLDSVWTHLEAVSGLDLIPLKYKRTGLTKVWACKTRIPTVSHFPPSGQWKSSLNLIPLKLNRGLEVWNLDRSSVAAVTRHNSAQTSVGWSLRQGTVLKMQKSFLNVIHFSMNAELK